MPNFTQFETGLRQLKSISGSVLNDLESAIEDNTAAIAALQNLVGSGNDLEVSGNGSIGGDLTVGNDLTVGDDLTVTDNLSVSGAATITEFTFAVGAFFANSLGVSILTDIYMGDNELYLRSFGDNNHGLQVVVGPDTTFDSLTDLDGPVLFGFGRGALGSIGSGENAALIWNPNGQVDLPYQPRISLTVNDTATLSLAEYDVFDEDNYGGSVTTVSNCTAQLINYTSTDGRFTVLADGTYQVIVNLYLQGAANGQVTADLNVDGSTVWTSTYSVHSSVDPTERSIVLMLDLSANQYVNVTVDGVQQISVMPGTTMNMLKVG